MYMTRDNDGLGRIALWDCKADELKQRRKQEWFCPINFSNICLLYPKKFKQMFPNQKLPRKGSCKYVKLRLYILGEGQKNG